ncbi:MAG TPA: hypothetical protein VJM10_04840 [Candidatus Methylomirabilis sp.]|nr:hypothetical protein [Candidatus Methylomirabilis sp.]
MVETRVKVLLAFLTIFLLGFAVGAMSLTVYHRRLETGRQSTWTGRFDRERYVKQMTEAVGIRPEQMAALNGVLDETRKEFLALRKQLNPQFDEIRRRARNRIRGILSPEQQARFELFVKRWDEERRAEEQAAIGPKAQERKP